MQETHYVNSGIARGRRELEAITMYQDSWSAELYHFQQISGGGRDESLWLELAQRTGGPVLELACGTARAMLPLARAGYEVCGVDLSSPMLAIGYRDLQAESLEVRERVHLVNGDMDRFELG